MDAEVLGSATAILEACRAPDRWLALPASAQSGLLSLGFERYRGATFQRSDSDVRHAWIIGDVHGDPVGLACSLAFIRHRGEPGDLIVLLGDLIDDLPESIQVIAAVAQAINAGDGRTLVCLRGNHDAALAVGPDARFVSSVDPADFCSYLGSASERTNGAQEESLAHSFVAYFGDAPSAIFLADGTLLAHGGVPHLDLHPKLESRALLGGEEACSDFVWARVANVRRRMVQDQSVTRSREIGSEDFQDFRQLTHVMFGSSPMCCGPVERMVRGHDHVEDRCEIFGGHWERRVVTINNMSRRLRREIASPPGPTAPCIVEWRAGEVLLPIRLRIDPEWQARMTLKDGVGAEP